MEIDQDFVIIKAINYITNPSLLDDGPTPPTQHIQQPRVNQNMVNLQNELNMLFQQIMQEAKGYIHLM